MFRINRNDVQSCNQAGKSYEIMKSYYDAIYKENPSAIIVAGNSHSTLNAPDKNEITGETISSEKALSMALDPTKYGTFSN